jgi:hypothetical protein
MILSSISIGSKPSYFSEGSLLFSDLNGSYTADQSLVVPVSGVLDLTSTTTFTVESWVYPTSSLGDQITVFGDTAGYTKWWSLSFNTNTNTLLFYWIDNILGGKEITGYDVSQTIPLSGWTHVAISVNSGTTKMFINGTELGLTGDVIPFSGTAGSTSQLQVGNWVNNGSNRFNLKGNLSNLRVNNTTALYTSGFTPSYLLTPVLGTSLLLKTRSSGPIYDSSPQHVNVTNINSVGWSSNSTAPDGLSPSKASSSAYQIKTDYPSSTDGLYWIKNSNISGGTPFQIYADMTTLGGGWTLILSNHSQTGWTFENSILKNQTTPPSDPVSITQNYSIIAYADYIKKSQSNFNYMFDANIRGFNGGAYTALSGYSFIERASGQTRGDAFQNTNGWRKNISELSRFPYNDGVTTGTWDYNQGSIEFRMPFYTNESCCGPDGNAFITTNGQDGSWWGTLVTGNWNPVAPWMGDYLQYPDRIWYWVR